MKKTMKKWMKGGETVVIRVEKGRLFNIFEERRD